MSQPQTARRRKVTSVAPRLACGAVEAASKPAGSFFRCDVDVAATALARPAYAASSAKNNLPALVCRTELMEMRTLLPTCERLLLTTIMVPSGR